MNPVVARVMAVLAAVGLVLGALAIRGRLDGSTGDDQVIDVPGTATPTPPGGLTEASVLVCAEDLRDVCRALHAEAGLDLELQVEAARTTADRLATTDTTDLAAWIVLDPWPALVDEARQRNGRDPLFGDRVTALASTPLVIIVDPARGAVLEARCGAITWSCVGDAARGSWAAIGGQETWGSPKPGHPAPSSATGLVITGQVAADRLGTTAFSARDLAADDFRAWFTTLERAITTFAPSAGSHLRQLLQFGPSTVDVVGALEAEPAALLPRVGARADQVRVVHPDPLLVVDLVVADLTGEVGGALADLDDVLRDAGWRLDAAPPAAFPGWPVLPDPRPALPAPGALEALTTTWAEVVR